MTTRPGYVWDATASEWVEIGQAAVVSPFKYQTSQPSSPATGDIWIDSDDEVPSVDSTLYYRWTKTMSGGETSLSGTDNNSLALKYTPGYESVFINGVLQVRGSDYVATTGTTVTGLTALTASDVVMVESIIAYSVGDTYTQTAADNKFYSKTSSASSGEASTVNINTKPWNMPWGYVTILNGAIGTTASGSTVLTAISSSFTHTANRKVRITGYLDVSLSGATNAAYQLVIAGTNIAYIDVPSGAASGATLVGVVTATGSSQTAVLNGLKGGSTTMTTQTVIPYILIEDIGPA